MAAMKQTTPLAAKPDYECSVCDKPFVRSNSMQIVCGLRCARLVPEIKRKAANAELKRRKEAVKSRGELQQEAQAAFNAYIRLRDVTAGHGCIDCGRPFEPDRPGGSVDAGHYRSVGSSLHLRFDERNVHAQRKNCNRPGGATPAAYRLGLIERIGLAAVEALEADQTVKKYTPDDFRQIRDTYKKRVKDMKAARE